MATNIEQRWANLNLEQDLDSAPQTTTITPPTNGLASKIFASADARTNKIEQLNQVKQQKINNLSGYEDVVVTGLEDADTALLSDGRKIRLSDTLHRYDAAEIAHPEHEDGMWNKTKNFLGFGDVSKSDYAEETQKRAASRLLNKAPGAITDQDMIDVGNMQQIQALADLTRSAGEDRWEAPLIQGAVQTDLTKGLNINAKLKTKGTDMYKRTLGSLANPETGIDTTAQAAEDPRLNAFAIENKTHGFTRDEKGNRVDNLDWDGTLGEAVDIAQSSLVKQYAGSVDALNNAVRGIGSKVGISDETLDKYVPENPTIGLVGEGKYNTRELVEGNTADELTGVRADTRQLQSDTMKTAEENVANGEWTKATGKVISVLPYMLGDSAGEIAALGLGTGGLVSAIGNRVNNSAIEYEKNNGEQPDAAWYLGKTVLDTAALMGEKWLVKSGLAGAVEKGLSNAKRTGAVAASTVGETVQEYYDYVQQRYMEQKEGESTLSDIATSPGAQTAALSGGVMGAGLKGTAESVGYAKDKLLDIDSGKLQDSISALGDKFTKKPEETITTKEPEYELSDVEAEELFTQADDVFQKHDMKTGTVKDRITSLRELEEKAYRINDNNENKKLLLDAIGGIKSDISKEIEGLSDVQEYSKLLGSKESFLDALDDVMEVNEYKVDGKLEDNLRAIAQTFGITDEAFQKIKKDYETVDIEATKSSKGYLTQGKALRSILDTVNPDKERVTKLVDQMKRYESSQVKWLKTYDRAKSELEAEVASYNASVKKGLADFDKKPTQKVAKVSANSSIAINVEPLEDGTYRVNEGGYVQTYEAKKRNIDGIRAEFTKSKEFFKKAGIDQVVTGVQTKPIVDTEIGSGKIKKAVEQVKKDFDTHGVTSIISTDNKDGRNKYLVSGNEQITNKKNYTKDDVVSVLVPHVATKEDFDKFLADARNKNSQFRKEIAAAQQAGATIVIDKGLAKYPSKKPRVFDYTDSAGKTTKKSVRDVLVNQLTSFGPVKYVSEFGTRVFRSEADMAKVKEAKTENTKKAEVKESELTDNFKQFMSSVNYDTITGSEDVLPSTAGKVNYDDNMKKYFDKEDKLVAYINNRVKKEIDEFVGLSTKIDKETKQRDNLISKGKTASNIDEADEISSKIDVLDKSIKQTETRIKELEYIAEIAKPKIEASKVKKAASRNILKRYNEAKKSDEITGDSTAEEVLSEASEDIVKNVIDNSYTKGMGDFIASDGLTYILDLSKVINVKESVFDLVEVTDMFSNLVTEEGIEISSEEYIKRAKLFVKNNITKYEGKDSDRLTMKSSPGYGLLFDKNGEVNDSVVMAIKLAIDEYISYKGSTLSPVYKSKEDTAQMLGILESQLGNNQYELLKNKGMFKKTIDNEVGKAVLKKLGMSRKSEVEDEVFNRIAAELGQVAGLIAEHDGLVEYTEVTVKEYQSAITADSGERFPPSAGDANIKFVRFTKNKKGKQNDKLIDAVKDKYKSVHEVLGEDEAFRKEPSRRFIAKSKRRHVTEQVAKDITGAKIPTGGSGISNEEALNNLIDTEYEYSVELIEELKGVDRDRLLNILGYKNESELDMLSFNDRDAQVSVNRDIVKNLDELLALDTSSSADTKMYFDWFFSSNGRYMMDSNTINPQTEKQLHRWLVTPAKHKTKYTVKDGVFKSGKKDVTDVVHYAIAQSMGFAVDKKSTDKINTFAKALLGLDKKELAEMKKTILIDGKHYKIGEFEVEIEHLGHFLQGLKFLENAKSGTFESNLSAEFDAVTSGFGLKLLQLPILRDMDKDRLQGIVNGDGTLGTVWYWLNKVGVFKPEQLKGKYDSMNDVLDSKGFYVEDKNFYDSYQSLAVDAAIDIDSLSAENTIYKKGTKLLNVSAIYKGISSALPSLNADATVGKALRNLFKDPFMTFNYSAGIKSIRASLSNKMVSDLIAGIVSEKSEFDGATKWLASYTNINKDVLIQRLRTEPLKSIDFTTKQGKTVNLEDTLLKTMDISYGHKVQEIMEKNFKLFMDTHKEINAAFKTMFEVFNHRYKAELEKVEAGKLTSEKKLEIIDKLRESFPAIKGPLSSTLNEGIHLYTTKSVTPSEEKQRQAPARSYVKGRDSKSMIARHMIREFEAAISAGSVVPIHYIDGAVMGQLLGKGSAITAIHDAIIPPLTEAKETIKKYNENVINIAKEYSVISAINDMLARVELTPDDIKELDTTKTSVAVIGEDGKVAYVEVGVGINFNNVKDKFKEIASIVKKARKELFDDIDEGVVVGHMAGLPGSMWSNVETKVETEQEVGTISRLDRLQQELGALVPMSKESEEALDILTEDQFTKLVNDMKNCI